MNGKGNKLGKSTGKGKGNGKGGGRLATAGGDKAKKDVAMGSNMNFTAFAKQTEANNKQLAKLTTIMEQMLAGSAVKKAGSSGGKELWTCPKCGDDRCFASRSECHKCGNSKPASGQTRAVPKPAAAAPAADAAAMDLTEEPVESLEDQIAEAEGLIKAYRGMVSSPNIKKMIEDGETKLKQLRDVQKRSRPLPARLQAATARSEKTNAVLEEVTKKAATLREQLAATEREIFEATAKVAEADAELQAVTELLAVGSAVGATNQAAQMLQWVMGALQLDEVTKAAIVAQAQTAFQGWQAPAVPQPPGLGQQAAAAASGPPLQDTAAQAAARAAAETAEVMRQATVAAEAAAAAAARATALGAAATAAAQRQSVAEAAAAVQHQAELEASAASAAVVPTRPLPARPRTAAPGTPVGGLLEGAGGARDRSKTPPGGHNNGIGC
jgi:hypothetical protein